MFYGYDGESCGGMISDYRLDFPMKQKSINFYVQDVPMILAESVMHNKLLFALPMGFPYGVRTRVWSQFYPDVQWLGEMVSYSTLNELGQAVEHMIPYAEFNMKAVPWDDIIA
uniref:Uncharacterized protein n=2 Tax=unclassified bacterial viruses TaxID=12333 RepID=A0AAU6VY05_9VIRU